MNSLKVCRFSWKFVSFSPLLSIIHNVCLYI